VTDLSAFGVGQTWHPQKGDDGQTEADLWVPFDGDKENTRRAKGMDECLIALSGCSLTCSMEFNGNKAELNGFPLVFCHFTEQQKTGNPLKSIDNIQAIRQGMEGVPGRVPNVEFTVKAASQGANSNFLRPPNSALKSKELKTRVVHV
jgi:hypothetical protein